jgi:hypothetical protein
VHGRLFLAFLFVILTSCGSDPESSGPQFTTAPATYTDPDSRLPLAAHIAFVANKPVKAHYELVNGDTDWEYTSSGFRSEHRQSLIGLPPGETHALSVTLIDKEDRRNQLDKALLVSIPAAAESITNFPEIVRESAEGLTGITLVSVFRFAEAETSDGLRFNPRDETHGLLIALDASMQAQWILELDYLVEHIEQESSETLTLVGARGRETIDFFGNRVSRWRGELQGAPETGNATVTTLEADNLHSESDALSNGNHLLLTTELRVLAGYPQQDDNPVAAEFSTPFEVPVAAKVVATQPDESSVVGDVILEVNPKGEVVNRWSLFDLIDYRRPSYHGHASTWGRIYPADEKYGAATSWTHANGVAYDPTNDTIIVSLRHQAAIVGIGRESRELKWILGDASGWRDPWSQKLLAPAQTDRDQSIEWPYFPSSITRLENGDILLVDSGGYRAVPPNTPSSPGTAKPRVLSYRIDEQAMQVTQTAGQAVELPANLSDHALWTAQHLNSISKLPDASGALFAQGYSGRIIRVGLEQPGNDLIATVRSTSSSEYRWGIADVLVTGAILPPTMHSAVATDAAVAAAQVADETVQNDQSIAGTQLRPDTSVPDRSIDGRWTLRMTNDPSAAEQGLSLVQNGKLVEGVIEDYPVVAWVQGNTFSMTVRREGSLGQVRLRYRGVINADANEIQGSVAIDHRGTDAGAHAWVAYKQ